MKLIKLTLILFFVSNAIFAQKKAVNPYATIDKKALQLPDSLTKTTDQIAGYITANFKSGADKSRAIFIWVASNIQYDIDNMFAINFYATRKDEIEKALDTRKGICENFASLFTDICLKSGIKSFVVEGYTKQNGFADYIPHAWSAALIDTSWFLFDPTWGSGYVNGSKFFKKINNAYYKANPALLIKTHMPFDYLWQFLNYPVTNQEFYEGKTQQNTTKPFFNFKDSIAAYEKEDPRGQLISSAYRVEKNGVKNSMVFDRLRHLKLEIERQRQEKIVNLYNSAAADFNEGVNDFNDFINYKNQRFIPMKTDAEIQNMVDVAEKQIEEAKGKLQQINNPDGNITNAIAKLTKSINDLSTHIKEQDDWLKEYFSKRKSGRKSMFYQQRITWFGIPLKQ